MKPFVFINALIFAASWSAMGQAQATFVTSSPDGIDIVYDVQGEGELSLVFVHGWSCDRSYWEAQRETFSRQFRVVTLDLAGHGESGMGREDWTMESFGGDVAAVVEALDLSQLILVGHSMGGDVIAEAARLLPGRVIGLVMVDTYKRLGEGRTPEQVQSFITRLGANFPDSTRALVQSMFLPVSDPSLVEQVAAHMSSAPPDIALSALEHAFHYSRQMTTTLQELKLPVVAINPANGPTDIVSLERHGVAVMIMPGVGHFLMMEHPKGFNRMLRTVIHKIVRSS